MGKEWESVIGLEVHVQLNTETKIFCSCRNRFGDEPNTNVCPVCLGFPGVLPVLNKKVVDYAIRVGLALNCRIASYSKFDRKNYFYPDLPKAYQISQYDLPICENGFIEIEIDGKIKKIGIKRVHMEEDAGKLIHGKDTSFVDYNRTGVPLLEIVSEPDIRSPQEAYEYLVTLRQIIRYLGVSDCDMEKGTLRCDANVSVRKVGQKGFGIKTEIKNLNSFKGVRDALEYEIRRQIDVLESGGEIIQETRLWNDEKGITKSMRKKEESSDYRYFPDPDLPPIRISSEWIEECRRHLPEMPRQRKQRLIKEYEITDYDAMVLCSEKKLADYFEEVARSSKNPKRCANFIISSLLSKVNEVGCEIDEIKVKPGDLAQIMDMWEEGKLNNVGAKKAFDAMWDTGKSAEDVVEELGLVQVSDEDFLNKVALEVIEVNPKVVSDYKSGKKNAVMFLVGQVMKKTKGKANPQKVKQILESLLDKGQ